VMRGAFRKGRRHKGKVRRAYYVQRGGVRI